jgi:hypothetical protein
MRRKHTLWVGMLEVLATEPCMEQGIAGGFLWAATMARDSPQATQLVADAIARRGLVARNPAAMAAPRSYKGCGRPHVTLAVLCRKARLYRRPVLGVLHSW